MPRTATINETFLANMRQLWRSDPPLAWAIDQLPFDARLNVIESRKGPPTASVNTDDGRTLFLHSKYDPQREAAELCKQLDVERAACVVLNGFGLGHAVKAIHEQLGSDTIIFVTESDLVTIKTAMEELDLARELATGHVRFITRLDKDYLHDSLTPYSTQLMLGTVFAVPTVARDHHAVFHEQARQAILDYASFAKMSLTTLVRNAEVTCRNIANNLPTYITTPPPDLLKNACAGMPSILVAAGPSLRKNIDQLAALRERAIIIAAQTTLRPLLERNISPHFVTTLDFSDLSKHFFEGLRIPEEVVLVAEPKASWAVIDAFRAAVDGTPRVVMLDNKFARHCLGERLAGRARIEPGATVMHLAFYLAQWLGCDPIAFIGQDLSFRDHTYYAPGVEMHKTWQPELGRFCTLEMKEWERIARHRPILRQVQGIDGSTIYTDEQMHTYLQQFERDFARAPQNVIDATEGGARKQGAEAMTLASATANWAASANNWSAPLNNLRWSNAALIPDAVKVLNERLASLAEFESLCRETESILIELEDLIDRPDVFNKRIARVDELRTLVQMQGLIFRMVRDVSQQAELRKISSDRRLSRDAPTDTVKAQRQLRRDRSFIESMLDGCARLRRILQDAIARFDRHSAATGGEGGNT